VILLPESAIFDMVLGVPATLSQIEALETRNGRLRKVVFTRFKLEVAL
jgi:hypothetical protein